MAKELVRVSHDVATVFVVAWLKPGKLEQPAAATQTAVFARFEKRAAEQIHVGKFWLGSPARAPTRGRLGSYRPVMSSVIWKPNWKYGVAENFIKR